MADLTLNFSMVYEDSNDVPDAFEIEDKEITLATDKIMKTTQTVGTSEEAIELGDITDRGSILLVNLNTTYTINIKTGVGGTIFAQLFPKGSAAGPNFCYLHLGSGAQTPYAIAVTGACEMLIILTAL